MTLCGSYDSHGSVDLEDGYPGSRPCRVGRYAAIHMKAPFLPMSAQGAQAPGSKASWHV